MSGRLARGRSYARAGQVLDFKLSQGKVTAQVQGSRVRPYQVRIGVLPLTTAQWRRVLERLAGQALFRAKLLAGEMPHEIEEVFAECGTPLFPRSATDLDMHCSCPDWGVPCKHLAAVCYVLAEEFDRDPFAMLAWRGKARDDLLAALREIPGPGRTGCRPGGRGGRAGRRWRPGVPPRRWPSAWTDVLVARAEPGPAARAVRAPGAVSAGPAAAHVPAAAGAGSGARTWPTCWPPLTSGWPPTTRAPANSASPGWLAGPATGRRPDAAHGLGQAPPAQRGQPVVVVDRAQDLPQRGDRQEQALHAELVELVVSARTRRTRRVVLVLVPSVAAAGSGYSGS